MISTFFTFTTTILVVVTVVIIMNIWIGNSSYELSFSSKSLLFILIVPFVRVILPFEFGFTKVIRSYKIYPLLYSFLFEPRTQLRVTFIQVIIMVWLIGSIMSFGQKLRQYYTISSCFNHIPHCADANTQALIFDYLKLNNVRNISIKVIQSGHIVEPIIYGVIKPTIVVPTKIFSNESDLHNVLLHEINHYIHGDLIFKWILEFVCSLYWFLLPIHTLKNHIYNIMEIRADYYAVHNKSKQDKIKYLNTLLNTCKNSQNKKTNTYFNIAGFSYGNRLIINRRFKAIVNFDSPKQTNYKNITILSLILILTLTIPYFFVFQPYATFPEDSQETFIFSDGDYYLKRRDGGGYEIYLDDELLCYTENLNEDMKNLQIRGQ